MSAGIDDLDMLDPPAAVARIFLAELLVGADHLRVGGIADGVDGDLEAAVAAASRLLEQLGVGLEAAGPRCPACRHRAA